MTDPLARILEASLIYFLGMRSESDGPLFNSSHECQNGNSFPIQDDVARKLAGALLMAEGVEKMIQSPGSIVEVPEVEDKSDLHNIFQSKGYKIQWRN